MGNVFNFNVDTTKVRAVVEDNWVEFTFTFKSGNWFRKFVSKAGYTGPDEIPVVARDILAIQWERFQKERKKA
jgi:hypothetical protein